MKEFLEYHYCAKCDKFVTSDDVELHEEYIKQNMCGYGVKSLTVTCKHKYAICPECGEPLCLSTAQENANDVRAFQSYAFNLQRIIVKIVSGEELSEEEKQHIESLKASRQMIEQRIKECAGEIK